MNHTDPEIEDAFREYKEKEEAVWAEMDKVMAKAGYRPEDDGCLFAMLFWVALITGAITTIL